VVVVAAYAGGVTQGGTRRQKVVPCRVAARAAAREPCCVLFFFAACSAKKFRRPRRARADASNMLRCNVPRRYTLRARHVASAAAMGTPVSRMMSRYFFCYATAMMFAL